MSITKDIRNGLLSSPKFNGYSTNAVSGANSKATQWTKQTAIMYETLGPYASNVFDAQIQGMDYGNFYNWKTVKLRSSNVIDVSTGDNLSAGWQEILILDRHVEFIPLGAFVKFNKATWIVVNTNSATMDSPTAIVVRCNSIYNTYDYYGNIVSVPYCLTNGKVLASSSFYTKYMVEIDGYAHIVMQLNEYTEKIGNTSRLIIGKSAYNVYGVVDSVLEFSEVPGSCHILKADIRLSDILPNDDMENQIANGDSFDIYVKAQAQQEMLVGSTQTVVAKLYKDDVEVEPTSSYPITYLWQTTDSDVATVSDAGVVTAVGEGECIIRCVLVENTSLYGECNINVSTASENDWVQFDSPVQPEARVFDTISISAAYYEDGTKTENIVKYIFSGADANSYTTTITNNSATIKVWRGDTTPLTVTASYNGKSASAVIKLLGM